MNDHQLLMGIAAVFSGITVLMAVMGFVVSPFLFFVALPFGGAAYLLWYHASGRLMERAQVRSRTYRPREPGRGLGPDGSGTVGGDRRFTRTRARQNRSRASNRPPRSTAPAVSRSEAYAMFDLSEDATAEEIRRAYRRAVKRTHPDTDSGDEEQFKRVSRAYDVLTE
ncbi:MAG: DnaJ domain-containing protein [Halobacteriota archaeon]